MAGDIAQLIADSTRLAKADDWGAEALRVNRQLAQAAPGSAPVLLRLARCLAVAGKLEDARDAYSRLFELKPDEQTRRIAIRDNIFLDVGGQWGNGRLFQLLDGTHGVAIDHNTAFQTGGILFGGDYAPHTAFVFQNNIVPHNEHGVTGSGTGPGTQTLMRYFPRAVFRGNLLIGATPDSYPPANGFPASLEAIGASPHPGPNLAGLLRLRAPMSRSATDGGAPGANVDAVRRALGALVARIGN